MVESSHSIREWNWRHVNLDSTTQFNQSTQVRLIDSMNELSITVDILPESVAISNVKTILKAKWLKDCSSNVCDRYNVTFMIVTYFLPIIAMGFAYTTVGLELWFSRGIGEYTDHQMDNIRSKRRVSFHDIYHFAEPNDTLG